MSKTGKRRPWGSQGFVSAGVHRALGQRIRQLREKKGLSQRAQAAACELSLAALQKIECGSANPSLDTLIRLSKGLKTTIHKLMREISH